MNLYIHVIINRINALNFIIMRYFMVMIMLLLAFHQTRAQEYIPLVEENKVWYCGYEIADFVSSYSVKLNGDTIINNKSFKKVIRNFERDGSDKHTVGYIREDMGKVFFMNLKFSEGLIYDFSAKKGDTINIQNMHTSDWWDSHHLMNYDQEVIIDSIYFSEIPEGKARRIIQIRSTKDSIIETWIEGIGSMAGILKSGYYTFCCTWGNYLWCYEENDVLLYKRNQESTSCWVLYTDTKQTHINDENTISIYPNPVLGDFLNIKYIKEFSGYISIYSVDGKLIYSMTQTLPTNETIIELPHIRNGLYIISLKRYSGNIVLKKIIIRNSNK